MNVTRVKNRQALGAVLCVLLASVLASSPASGGTVTVNPERSSLTVHVFKSGFLSALGDNHVIRAPLASGSVEEGSPPGVEIAVDARRMTVLDPDLSAAKRREVQERMLGPEVLDVSRYPEIRFRSTSVKPVAAGRWRVEGVLALHGRSAPVSFEVTESKGEFRGSAKFAQTAFGIRPISIAGGTVKVKDELTVDFAIATSARGGK